MIASRSRGPNMMSFEDETLYQVYVTLTSNLIVEINQSYETFWETVRQVFQKHPDILTVKTIGSFNCISIQNHSQYHFISLNLLGNNESTKRSE